MVKIHLLFLFLLVVVHPNPPIVTPKNCDPLNLAKGDCSDSDSNVCDSTNIAKGSCTQPNLPDNDSNCDLNNFTILDCNATPDYDSKSDTKCNTDIDINDTKCNPKNESNSCDSNNTKCYVDSKVDGVHYRNCLSDSNGCDIVGNASNLILNACDIAPIGTNIDQTKGGDYIEINKSDKIGDNKGDMTKDTSNGKCYCSKERCKRE